MSPANQRGLPPKYAQMAARIRQDIIAGMLGPGDRVPSEPELVAEYGVSKTTANEALRLLVAEGLIVRVTGTGSFVADPLVIPGQRTIEAPLGSRVSVRWPRSGEVTEAPPGVMFLIVEYPGAEGAGVFLADRSVVLFA